MKKIILTIILGLVCFTSIKNVSYAEEQTLKILSAFAGGNTPEEDKLFVAELEKKLGFKIKLERSNGNYKQKIMTSFASKDPFDVIMLDQYSDLDLFVEQGLVMDLTPYIKKSPILSDLSVIPQSEWDLIKTKEGKFYAIFYKKEGAVLPTVRKDWMKAQKIKNPRTLEEYTKMFEIFKKKYNAYGLSIAKSGDELQPFMGTQGLVDGYEIVDGKRTIPYASDKAAVVYNWLADLNKKGLLDPNYLTNQTSDMRNNFFSDKAGMVVYWDLWVGLFNNIRMGKKAGDTFEAAAIPSPLSKDGKEYYKRKVSLWVVSSKSKNADLAAKFFDFWISEDGNILSSLGIEGHDYTKVDGKYVLTPIGKEHGMDHGAIIPQNKKFKNPIGLFHGVAEAKAILFNNPKSVPHLAKFSPKWSEVIKIMDKYQALVIQNKMSGEEAVKNMRKDLKAQDLID